MINGGGQKGSWCAFFRLVPPGSHSDLMVAHSIFIHFSRQKKKTNIGIEPVSVESLVVF